MLYNVKPAGSASYSTGGLKIGMKNVLISKKFVILGYFQSLLLSLKEMEWKNSMQAGEFIFQLWEMFAP